MSGGAFEYKQYHIEQLIEDMELLLKRVDKEPTDSFECDSLKNYIDESFDERINSSTFSHKSSTEKFAENVEEAKEEGLVENVGYSENKEVMDNLILKYGEYSENVINKN